MRYPEEAAELFKRYVPRSGQAETEQGELIRAVEKLADEARRHGNAHWSEDFERLAEFVRDRLTASSLFDRAVKDEIEADVDRILAYEDPVRRRRALRPPARPRRRVGAGAPEADPARPGLLTAVARERRVELEVLVAAGRAPVGGRPALEPDDHLAQAAWRHRHARRVAVTRRPRRDDQRRAPAARDAQVDPARP